LKQSERVDESIEHLERALLLLHDEPSSKEFILEMLIVFRVELGQFHSALNNVDELWTTVLKLYGDTRVGNASRVLRDCEMVTMMLLLVIQTLPHQMNGRQTHLMDMYRRITCPLTPLPKETALDDEDFLCLKSFLLSLQERDVNGADRALDKLSEKAIDPVLELGLVLVERIATDGDEV